MSNEKELNLEELDKVSGGWNSDAFSEIEPGTWYDGDRRVFYIVSPNGMSGSIWVADVYTKQDDNTIKLKRANTLIYLSDFRNENAREMGDSCIYTIV